MWLFSQKCKTTLTHAVCSGDIRAVKKILKQGAEPNRRELNDDIYPIHYALGIGPEMVQLLIDYGADVNIPNQRNGATPLAYVEAKANNTYASSLPPYHPSYVSPSKRAQFAEVASVLRKAGAKLSTGHEEFTMDPRLRLELEWKMGLLITEERQYMRYKCLKESPEQLAKRVEKKLNLTFSADMSHQEQERVHNEIRALIKKNCQEKP